MRTLIEILQFTAPFWLVNLSLNLIYVTKLYFPKLKEIDNPIDLGNKLWDKRRILGESTTILGLPVAITAGVVATNIFLSETNSSFYWGFLTGVTVYCGHALGSFIKRRFNYADGQFMPLVDHGDYIILAAIVFGFTQQFKWPVIVLGILITYLVHPIVTYIAYLFRWHKHPL